MSTLERPHPHSSEPTVLLVLGIVVAATDLSVGAKAPVIHLLGIVLLSIGAFVSFRGGGAIYAARTRRRSASAPVVASAYPGDES
jgi:hypothetical protein